MFDGKTFRSVYEYNDVEKEALTYYFEDLLKTCHCKEDFCKHCLYYSPYYPLHFFSACHFCLDLKHMQFEPPKHELYDKMAKLGKITYAINS